MKLLLCLSFVMAEAFAGTGKFVEPVTATAGPTLQLSGISLCLVSDKVLNADSNYQASSSVVISLHELQQKNLKLEVRKTVDRRITTELSDSLRIKSFQLVLIPKQGEFHSWKLTGDTIPLYAIIYFAPGMKVVIQDIRAEASSTKKNFSPIVIEIRDEIKFDSGGKEVE